MRGGYGPPFRPNVPTERCGSPPREETTWKTASGSGFTTQRRGLPTVIESVVTT